MSPTVRRGPGALYGGEAVSAVAGGTVTAEQLYEDAVRRVEEWEPELGAIVEQIPYRSPVDGPLRGMCLGVKVYQDVSGFRNWRSLQTQGVEGPPASGDSTVVSRLRQAGATLVGTTAAPFLGVPGGVTPQTRNARSPDRVSGGSSGGSASAVAAGMIHGALGSDSGGSIRIPAACCGVVGLQTTRGLVPLTGARGLTYSMGNVGPIASTVEDARLILDVIAGFDPEDPYSVPTPPRETWDGTPLSFGVPAELVDQSMDPEVRSGFEGVIDGLRAAGHGVEPVSLPILLESMQLGPQILGIVESGSIIEESLVEVSGSDPELRQAVSRAQQISGLMTARSYHRVAVLRSKLRQTFEEVDFLLTPTLPCRVPDGSTPDLEVELDVGGATETRTSALTRLVNPWNLAALPAGTLPIARDDGGAAVSLQVVGPSFSDWKVLDVMGFVEDALGGPWDTVSPPE